ncbi:hypothetical protein C1645_829126 [Glomus cerebriforme]|uniref:Uncharacterized protein n=1 Tax=Glomus cerebriforme TaxID=658196 RepID=A0A397SR78_9GLOM|nr:hypothetical protein C1645_829126 [Glomus cerebriforme]
MSYKYIAIRMKELEKALFTSIQSNSEIIKYYNTLHSKYETMAILSIRDSNRLGLGFTPPDFLESVDGSIGKSIDRCDSISLESVAKVHELEGKLEDIELEQAFYDSLKLELEQANDRPTHSEKSISKEEVAKQSGGIEVVLSAQVMPLIPAIPVVASSLMSPLITYTIDAFFYIISIAPNNLKDIFMQATRVKDY